MKLSKKAQQQLQEFFRIYFDNKDFVLPNANIFIGRIAGLITRLISVHGITIGKSIFISPDLVSFDKQGRKNLSRTLVAHELTHVIQYHQNGFFKFLYRYLKSYFQNLKRKKKMDFKSRMESYFEIPFEIEARDVELAFESWAEIENVLEN